MTDEELEEIRSDVDLWVDGWWTHESVHRLIEEYKRLRGIVEELAENSPACHSGGMWHDCFFCNTPLVVDDSDHADDCLWLRAKKIVETN